jgi:protein-disulfide isomerase
MNKENKNIKKDNSQKGEINNTESRKSGKKDDLINFILAIILVAGIGWLIFNGRQANKNNGTASSLKNKAQVEKFINSNSKDLFSKAKMKIKNTEKEDGLWRSILDIDGQVQDFYLTVDGQLIQGVKTVSKIMKSDKEEVLGSVNKNGEIEINDDLKVEIKKFIENNLVNGKVEIEIKEVVREHGLIKAATIFKGQEQPLYLTTDGKKVVFGVISMEEYRKALAEQKKAQEKAMAEKKTVVSEDKKSDKPVVEYFVMSYCPYGTQFEKGIIPVLRLLGNKIDAKMRFVNYAMHDKKEIDENLSQYCIQKEQGDKFYDYLECFLGNQDSKKCLDSAKIDQVKLASCIAATDKEFSVTKNYEDKSTWKRQYPTFNTDNTENKKYGVGSSPTFIINGETISSGRDSASLLKAICSGFKNTPEECDKKLSTTTPAAGFGSGKASSTASEGGCAQ